MKEKCICEVGEVEENWFYDVCKLEVPAGIFGTIQMDAFISLGSVDEDAHITITLDGVTPDGYSINDDTFRIVKPIKYCPFCGRRLRE